MKRIFSGEVEEIVLEFNRVCDRLNRTTSNSEAICCVTSINNLNELYCTLVGHDIYGYKKFLVYNIKRIEEVESLNNKLFSNCFKSFIKNKELMEDISYKMYKSIKNQFINETLDGDIVTIDNFSENELFEILCDFLMEYHPDKIKLFDSMVANGRIFSIDDMGENGIEGLCYPVYKGLPFVIVKSSCYSLSVLVRIFHEFGHAVDFFELDDEFSTNTRIKYLFNSLNVEMPSLLYEKEGIDFLIEKKINVSFAQELLRDFYENIMINALGTYTLMQFPKDRLYSKMSYPGNSKVENILTNSYLSGEDNNILVENLSLDAAVIYYIGGISSIILSDELHKDRERGNKIYSELATNKTKLFLPEFLNILGYSDDKMEKIMKKDFKRINSK